MEHLQVLKTKIIEKSARIGVIGLGYVGLPVAASFAEVGFQVVGVDLKQDRVKFISRGKNPIRGKEPGLTSLIAKSVKTGRLTVTTDYHQLENLDVVLIDVETPVNADHLPEYRALRSACESLGRILTPGTLVIVESTVAPGTVENLVAPILSDESALVLNHDYFLGVCPERVMPGKLLANLHRMSRVCGGSTPEVAQLMVALYQQIVDADLDPTSIITAELTKTVENAYRDVQIAFANEVAMICEVNGGDVWEVRGLVNKSPGRQMLLPGAGVGGHCIPKDPWLLVSSAGESFEPLLIPAARRINENMPNHMLALLTDALEEAGVVLENAVVCVLGFAYLEESDDIRNSPSADLVQRLTLIGAEVRIHDPWVPAYQGDVLDCLKGADALVVMVAHQEYRNLDLNNLLPLLRHPIVIDGRHVFEPAQSESLGLIYRCVGIGKGRNG